MVKLEMNGPYKLTIEKIDEIITKTSAGNYALGYMDDSTFFVKYVGRSDDDIKKRLKKWVGNYASFKYSYASSPKSAFEKECKNFHDFGGSKDLDNEIHPDRPNNSGWKCPYCDIFD